MIPYSRSRLRRSLKWFRKKVKCKRRVIVPREDEFVSGLPVSVIRDNDILPSQKYTSRTTPMTQLPFVLFLCSSVVGSLLTYERS